MKPTTPSSQQPADGDGLDSASLARRWDDVFRASGWGRWPAVDAVRALSRLASGSVGLRVLELGCGPGAQLWMLDREGHVAFGVDVSRVALERARERLVEEAQIPRLVQGIALALPLASSAFEIVLDVEALAYTPRAKMPDAWREVRRVLRPGGSLITIGFSERCDRRLADYLRHPTLLGGDEIAAIARSAGLRLLDQQVSSRTEGPDHLLIEELVTVACRDPDP